MRAKSSKWRGVYRDKKRLKVALSLAFVSILLTGCTSRALRSSTVAASETLPAIWEAQFLDNIGRFVDDDRAVPAVLVLHAGQIRVTTQVSPTYKLPYQFADPTKRSHEADLGAQFTWDEQWSVVPVTAKKDLESLGSLFKRIVDSEMQLGNCMWAGASETKWLCVDPAVAPDRGVDADKDRWMDKGRHGKHTIWVRKSQYSLKLIEFLTAPATSLDQQNKNVLLSVPLQ